MRILAADDNPDDRQLVVREVLALYPDATVVEVNNQSQLDAALATAPDLTITDLALRWSNGRMVLSEVKRLYPTCPVIMFTGSGDETTAVELMKAGLDDYVVKSARQLPRLRASIRIAIEAARARRGLTEREAQLTAALAAKDVVVQELRHRVKNNLQVITSLLDLRARRAPPKLATQLAELSGRMRALATVQARIYAVELLDRVDFRAALADMARSLTDLRGGGAIDLVLEADGPLDVDVGRAMPLGLLCYEIILNAFKHAWPAGQAGRLAVTIHVAQGAPTIRISDDGAGFAAEAARSGLGTQLMRALANEARVAVETASQPGQGTSVTIHLN